MKTEVFAGDIRLLSKYTFLKHVFGDEYQHINRYGLLGPNHINFWSCHQWWDNAKESNYEYNITSRNNAFKIKDKTFDSSFNNLRSGQYHFTMSVDEFKNTTGDTFFKQDRNNIKGNLLYWENYTEYTKDENVPMVPKINVSDEYNLLYPGWNEITFRFIIYNNEKTAITKVPLISFKNGENKMVENFYIEFLNETIYITVVVLKDDNGVTAYNIYTGNKQTYNDGKFKIYHNDNFKVFAVVEIDR